MKGSRFSKPVLKLGRKPCGDSEHLICSIKTTAPENLAGESRVFTVENYPQISSLSLEVAFDDELITVGSSQYISGSIILVAAYLDKPEQRIELTRPQLLVPPPAADSKGRVRYNMPYLNEIRTQVENIWKDAFKSALVALDSMSSSDGEVAPDQSKTDGLLSRLKAVVSAKSRIKDFLIAGSVVAVIFYGFDNFGGGKSAAIKATDPLDPAALSAQHEATMDKIYQDLGIDRSKMDNDLSCFSEE